MRPFLVCSLQVFRPAPSIILTSEKSFGGYGSCALTVEACITVSRRTNV